MGPIVMGGFKSCKKKIALGEKITPLKINMEHHHGGLVQIIFLSKWVICRFHVNLPGCKGFPFVKVHEVWVGVFFS